METKEERDRLGCQIQMYMEGKYRTDWGLIMSDVEALRLYHYNLSASPMHRGTREALEHKRDYCFDLFLHSKSPDNGTIYTLIDLELWFYQEGLL